MSLERKRHPQRLSSFVLGAILYGISGALIVGPGHAHAQDLEDNIDAELDDAIGASDSTPSAPKKAATPPPAKPNTQAAQPKKDAEPLNAMEDDLLMDEGDDPLADSDVQLETEPVEEAPKKAQAPVPIHQEPPPIAEEPPQISEQETPSQSSFGDEPNVALEKRLHRIFKNAKPVGEEKWSEMIGQRRAEVYGVQAGDTLWDISQTFFGDGLFWSKLWAENGSIENPHKIVPGKGIRFIAGTEADAPSVDVTETAVVATNSEVYSVNSLVELSGDAPVYKEQVRPLSDGELEAGAEMEAGEIIPRPELPPAAKSNPVLKQLPPSFVMPKTDYAGNYDSTGLDAPRPRAQTATADIIINSYLAEDAPRGIGRVEEVELGEKVASLGQNVFVKLEASASAGQKLYVIYPKEKIADQKRGKIGPIVEVGGILEIVEPVNPSKGIYKAAVTYSVNPIRVGSLIVNEALPRATFSRKGTRSDVQVRVVGGEFDETRHLFGEGAVIFLDGGSNAGLRNGDLLSVQSRRDGRREDTKFPEATQPIGLIKIVKTLSTVATAVVLEAAEEIRPGDQTGGAFPKPKKKLRVEGPGSESFARLESSDSSSAEPSKSSSGDGFTDEDLEAEGDLDF